MPEVVQVARPQSLADGFTDDRGSPVEIQELKIDPIVYRITARGRPVRVSGTEFRLLHFLMSNPEVAHSRDHLVRRVWGGQSAVGDRAVDVYVRRLRKALSQHGYDRFIQTVRSVGYRFSTLE